MKREFIKGLLPDISDEILGKIMDEHSKDIGVHMAKVTALETERDGLKTQLKDANTTINSYKEMDMESFKKKAEEWEAKYNTDTKALQDKLDAQAYDYAVERTIPPADKFSSASARKAFAADLKAKGLKLENGALLGYDDFLKEYKETDPGAFTPDDTGGKPQPSVVSFTHGGGTPGAASALRAAFGLPDKT